MANSSQAKKRARQAEVRRCRNASQRSEMRTYLKQVTKTIDEGNESLAKTLFNKASSMVARLASRGVIAKNKASRHQSRLNARLKKLALAEAKPA